MKLNTKLWATIPSAIFIVFGALLIFCFNANAEDTSANQDLMSSMGISKFKEKIKAPDFALKDLKGKKIRLSNLRGKVVLVNFWTTW